MGQSSRRNGISSRFVLSHHHTYRSVYGGFLLYISRWADVVFSYPHDYYHSNLIFGFRPIPSYSSFRSLISEHLINLISIGNIHLLSNCKIQPFNVVSPSDYYNSRLSARCFHLLWLLLTSHSNC